MRLPGVVFTFIVVSTYLYVSNVITVVLLGRVHRIFSTTRQPLLWKRKSSAKIEKSTRTAYRRLQNSDGIRRSGGDDEKVAKEQDSTKLLFVFDKAGDIRWYNPAG